MTTFARRFASFASLSVTATLLACLGVACEPAPASPSDSDLGGTERVELALTAIPAGTRCVRITAIGASRMFQEDFDVTGATSLAASVGGLPAVTALTISADAFAVACTSLTPTTQATWISAPVAVTIAQGTVPAIALVLRPAAGVSGAVDFLFLAATPTTKAFASTVVGQKSAVTTFTIQNVGPSTTGALAASLTGTGANQFSLTSVCTAALAAAQTCTVQVTFAPTAAGAKAATLQVAGTPGGTLAVALTGTALQPAVLALTPPAQDYGAVGLGRASAPVRYVVTNTGGVTTAPVTAISSDPAFLISGSTCTDVLATNGTCTFNVQFVPAVVAPRSAALTAIAGTVMTTAMVTGNGVAAPALTLTPNALDFGTVVVGESKSIPVTVRNVGGFPLDTFSALLGGTAGDAVFVVDPRNCSNGGPLAPGAACTVTVTAAPATDLGGPTIATSATLLVSVGGANPASVMGTAAATISWPLIATPLSVFFGSVKLPGSATATVRFTNVGTRPVGPVSMSMSGLGSSSGFSITSDGCTTTAQYIPGASCNVSVRFTPPSANALQGGLMVQLPTILEGIGLYGTGTF